MSHRRLLPIIAALAPLFTSCAPEYQSTRELMPNSGAFQVTGVAVGKFSGELNGAIQDGFVAALRAAGYARVVDTRFQDPQGVVEVKVEGDSVTQRTSDPRPSKLERGEARVLELRTGRLLMRYNFAASGPQQVRSPSEFARDIVNLMAKDFVPRK